MASGSTTAEPGGIERAVQLLKLLATAGKRGRALTQLAEATALPHSTVHRLLRRLMHERLVVQKESDKWYALGPLAFELGLAAMAAYDLREHCRASLSRLAEEVGDTVYLSLRAGDSALCVARQTGSFPIRTLTLEVGDYRPLGLGAGSLALLSALPDEEVEQVIARNREKLAPHANFDQVSLRAMVRQTREQGHSLNDGKMLPEMAAIGVIVHDASGRPAAALSIATIASRMQPERRASIVALLMREARALEQALGVTTPTPSGARE